MSVTLAALLAVYTIARCVLCLKILFAIIFIIISDEIFQLSHVIFIIQFLSTKIQNVNQFFFADTCTRRVPIFVSAKQIHMLSQTYRTVPYHTVMLPYVNT